MGYIIVATAVLFILIGFALKYLRWDWLIAGYNTMSKEKKQRVDVEGLRNFLGNSMFVIAGIFLLMFMFLQLGFKNSLIATIVMAVVYFMFMAIYAQRFSMDKAEQRKGIIVMIVIFALSAALIAPMFFFGGQDTVITVGDQEIKISGMYGTTIAFADLEDVKLVEEIPRILARTNGYAAGSVLKGNFKLEELGYVKLYLMSDKGPYLIIQDKKGYYIVNYKDQSLIIELYDKIINH